MTSTTSAFSGISNPFVIPRENPGFEDMLRLFFSESSRASSTTTPSIEYPVVEERASIGREILSGAYQIALSSGIGYLTGLAFGIINPIGGAVFGAAAATTNVAIEFISQRLGISNTCAKVAIYGISLIAGIGLGALATTYVGIPITFLGGVGLTLAMVVTKIAVGMLVAGTMCCSACIGGAALAVASRRA